MATMDQTLENYEIVQYLKKHSNKLYSKCESMYVICNDLLNLIPFVFQNYTIHDIHHSIRVIGYMNDLVKSHLNDFSCLHLAIMIFAGLLHDTGMVVTANEKAELYAGFTERIPGFADYSDEEKTSYLQKYIRENHGNRVGKIINEPVNPDMNIKGLLYVGDKNSYDISSIVVDICTAHNEDTKWIADHLTDDLYFGKDKINPQHIAVLLRIGDVLDIDDRRAPYMIYHLLQVKGYGDAEWRQHIPITNYDKIDDKNGSYTIKFYVNCDDPDIFRKVISYIDNVDDWIAKDIALCTDEYKISIKLPIRRKINTKGFDSKPLQFMLDYKQITSLLMGEKIYGSKKQGLRELIQNAIDAVMVMKDIKDKTPIASYTPTVGITINKDENQLIVYDNGIGMSEKVLDEFFFNIGKSFYESDEYYYSDHSYSPIGHFGIGFLSCFMLSAKITLETKHYSEGSESIRMSFDKDSQHIIKYKSTKEKPIKLNLEHGTRIIMEYDQIIPNVFPDVNSIESYIKDLLLDNNFVFVLCNPPDNKNIDLIKPRYVYKDEEHKEEVRFDYVSDPNQGHFLYNVASYFGKKSDAYLVDNSIIVEIGTFADEIKKFEAQIQVEGGDINKIITSDNLNGYNNLKGYSEFFYKFVTSNLSDIKMYLKIHKGVIGYFLDYLASYITGNELVWYEYPCIINSDIFNRFLNTYDRLGRDKALEKYKNHIINARVLCKTGEPDPNTVLKIMSQFIYKHSDKYDGNVISIDYYDKYPVKPNRRGIRLIKSDSSNNFARVTQRNKKYEICLYSKGIRVEDKTISMPYAIDGIGFESIILDLKSDRFGLDVARNSFDSNVKDDIEKTLACAVYGNLMEIGIFTTEEKQLIAKFLNIYYDKNNS